MLAARCDDAAWDELYRLSPQRNLFCDAAFLAKLGLPYELWAVEHEGRLQAGLPLVLGEDGHPWPGTFPYSLYMGLLTAGFAADYKPLRRARWVRECVDALLETLSQAHPHFTLCHHPSLEDMRPFQWFHYDRPDSRMQVDLRYTGVVDVTPYATFEDYLVDLNELRRRNYRQAAATQPVLEVSDDVETLLRLHGLSYAHQGREPDPADLRQLRILAGMADGQKGELLIVRREGRPLAASLFLWDDRCSYYITGGNDLTEPKHHPGTWLFLENIRRAHERGLQSVDMLGMNSPARGDFKSSLHAVLKPYFVTSWRRP